MPAQEPLAPSRVQECPRASSMGFGEKRVKAEIEKAAHNGESLNDREYYHDLFWEIGFGATDNPFYPLDEGESLVHAAAMQKGSATLEFALENGGMANCDDRCSFSPLFLAVYWHCFENIRYLIEHGADVNRGQFDRFRGTRKSPLFIAVKDRLRAVASSLISQGAQVDPAWQGELAQLLRCNPQDIPQAVRPARDIFAATKDGDLDRIKTLIASGTSPNQTDSRGRTPLLWAAFIGHESIARALIDAGAHVSVQDRDEAFPFRGCSSQRASWDCQGIISCQSKC